MTVKVTTDKTFKDDTKDGITLTSFWATWCPGCRMQAPVNEALSEELTDIKFTKMDVDQNPTVTEQFQVMSIPTMLVQKDGKPLFKIVGYHPKEQMMQILKEQLGEDAVVE